MIRAATSSASALSLLSIAVVVAVGGCSTSRDDALQGRTIADQWCAECHRVAPDQPSGSRVGHILPSRLDGPSFMSVAIQPGIDAKELRRFMSELHPPMPIYRLNADEQESVIRYILSLRSQPS